METLTFSALGTQWSVLVDHDVFAAQDQKMLLDEVTSFERRFSRFLPESEVTRFREAEAGTYEISEVFAVLLKRADTLRMLTGGVYDPAIGGLLERAGYDAAYRLTADVEAVTQYTLPRWSLSGQELWLSGSVVFDLGGIGKGYCIDLVASTLERLGYQYYLVEGGGDMYGTTKRDSSPYRVALEWPGKPDTAFGVVALQHQGVAVSDSAKRRWGGWHHIINPREKKPIETIIGATALAPSAFAADCMTSGLFLSASGQYGALARELGAAFVVFKQDGTAEVSPDWIGELF